jgi:DNA-binding HxlR family transcriptional regulator
VCGRDCVNKLTGLGETILSVVVAIKQWSEAHNSEIHAARDTYDQRS